jgi:hypothetical protein
MYRINLKFSGRCNLCGRLIPKGYPGYYGKKHGKGIVTCLDCISEGLQKTDQQWNEIETRESHPEYY